MNTPNFPDAQKIIDQATAQRMQPPPSQVNVMAGFVVDPNNPAIGKLHFEVGPASFDLGLNSAAVVGFLRALADDTEARLAQQPKLARPIPGLFLPNGAAG